MENLGEAVGFFFIEMPIIFVWIIGVVLSITHWAEVTARGTFVTYGLCCLFVCSYCSGTS